MMKEMKRVLSMVLCLVMILGMMPMVALNASAAEGTDGESDTAPGRYKVESTETKSAYVPVKTANAPSGNVLIVNSNAVGEAYLLSHNNDNVAAVKVKIAKSGENIYIETTDVPADAIWTVSSSYKFRNNSRYLRYENGLKATNSDRNNTWTYKNGFWRVRSGANNYYLRFNGTNWETTNSTGNASPIYFYTLGTVPGEDVYETGTFAITADSPIIAAVSMNNGECESSSLLPVTVTFTTDDGEEIEVEDLIYEEEGRNVVCTVIEDDEENPVIDEIVDGEVYFTGVIGTAKVRVAYTLPESTDTIVTYIEVVTTPPYYAVELVNRETGEDLNAIVPIKNVEDGASYNLEAIVKEFDGATDDDNMEETDDKVVDDVDPGDIVWASSNPAVATVANGVVTFHGIDGVVTITATYTDEDRMGADGQPAKDSVTFSATTTQYMVPSDGTLDFPEYPHDGAIRFDKTAEAVGNFSQTGVAQLELSMTGIPFGGKGTDVIIMLDTSSSMTKNNVTGTNKTRAAVLEDSLAKLLTQLKKQDANGNYMDINVAIADFNGYYGDGSGGKSGTPYDRTRGDYVKNGNSTGSGYSQASQAKVYTGRKALDAEAFVPVSELAASYTLNYTSGTNYDYAFDAIYQLGTAIKAENTEDRELIVIFMSDGASLQWNYFGTQNTYTNWNNWLAGTWEESDLTTRNLNSTAHSYFYDLNDHDNDGHINEHRMANAIKGSPAERYEIIRKSTAGLPAGTLVSAGEEYLYTVPGLGATMYTINFDAKQDGSITVDSIDKALASTASDKTGDTQYYYKITTADQLDTAFKTIGHAIIEAASNIVVTDKITEDYTMIFGIPQSAGTDEAAATRNQNIQNALAGEELYIEVINYNLDAQHEREGSDTLLRLYLKDSNGADAGGTYSAAKDKNGTAADTLTFVAKGGSKMAYWSVVDASATVGENDIVITVNGTTYKFMQKGNGTHNVASGAYAFGNIDAMTNMSEDLVIITPYFAYSAKTRMLAWTVDKLEEFKEIALRYFLYLHNSATEIGHDGVEAEAGPYPTNEWAYMTYTNHLGNLCRQEFPKPRMNWNGAQVSYVFYLVNSQGQPINKYGQVVDFANATFVTDVFTKSVVWNDTETDENEQGVAYLDAQWMAEEKVPEGYKLFDVKAYYELTVYEDHEGNLLNSYFKIDGSESNGATSSTTKVYNTKADAVKYSAYGTYSGDAVASDFDFANTTVAFAIEWKAALVPDAVVVDYGLDVLINVVQNDFMQNTVSGIGMKTDIKNSATESTQYYADPMFSNKELKIDGNTIKMEEGKEGLIRFHQGDMTFEEAVTFYYESPVRFYENSAWVNQYMYSSVTVIPATTIYYEDEFLSFTSFTNDGNGNFVEDKECQWVTEGNAASATQNQDRPGASKISETLDADNNYGYDSAYEKMSTYSLGSAAKFTVTADTRGEATFTFCGTGFDVVGLTSNMTGMLMLQVRDEGGNLVKSTIVDTYYGYTRNDKGEWVVTSDTANALYQVPVIEITGLTYGQHTVRLVAAYNDSFNHTQTEGAYDLYLDAIRIYDPTGNKDTTSNDAYKADGEAYPEYFELRDKIISANAYNTLTDDSVSGIVFIDGTDGKTEVSIADYTSYGPNNETYLAKNQAVAFTLNATAKAGKVAKVQIAIKTVGNGGHVEIYGVDSNNKVVDCLDEDISTATDMYYDITALNGKNVVIKSTGDAVISITNVKVTYTEAQPEEAQPASGLFTLRRSAVNAVLATMAVEEEPEVEVPETTVPEETEPEVPETTVPEKPTRPTPEKPNPSKPNPGKPNPGKPGPNKPNPGKPEEESKFEPTVKVKIKKPTVDQGKNVDVEIRTSDDVALITVNGKTVTKYKTDRKSGDRIWKVTLKAERAGDLEVEVIAYSEDGYAAKPVTETVKVVAKNDKKGKGKKK